MDQVDETVARVRARGPVPLPLNGWDHASIWGWDETTTSPWWLVAVCPMG
jgi:hypothetical protein